jgi:hypothetical protein
MQPAGVFFGKNCGTALRDLQHRAGYMAYPL